MTTRRQFLGALLLPVLFKPQQTEFLRWYGPASIKTYRVVNVKKVALSALGGVAAEFTDEWGKLVRIEGLGTIVRVGSPGAEEAEGPPFDVRWRGTMSTLGWQTRRVDRLTQGAAAIECRFVDTYTRPVHVVGMGTIISTQ